MIGHTLDGPPIRAKVDKKLALLQFHPQVEMASASRIRLWAPSAAIRYSALTSLVLPVARSLSRAVTPISFWVKEISSVPFEAVKFEIVPSCKEMNGIIIQIKKCNCSAGRKVLQLLRHCSLPDSMMNAFILINGASTLETGAFSDRSLP